MKIEQTRLQDDSCTRQPMLDDRTTGKGTSTTLNHMSA